MHMERLTTDCRTLFDADLDLDHVRYLVRHALTDVDRPIVARVTVFDPDLDFGSPGSDTAPRVLVTARPPATAALPALRLQSVRYSRELPEVKHVGLFPMLKYRRTAQRSGFDDVLFVEPDETVSEIATSNIGVVDGDRVVWPAAACLPGVTMRLLDDIRGEHHRAPLPLADLAEADAVFATNAAVGIRPISDIDDIHWSSDGERQANLGEHRPSIGEHPMLATLRAQYATVEPEPL